MAVKFFGQFLLGRGRITGEDLIRAVAYQQRKNLKIGELAMRDGVLTREQVRWLSVEQRRSDRLFGELAIDRGWMSREVLDGVMEKQKREHIRVGEVLVVLGALTRDQLDGELAAFQTQQESDAIPARLDEQDPDRRVLQELAQGALRLLVRTGGVNGRLGLLTEEEPPPDEAFVQAGVTFSGAVEGTLVVRMPRALALWVARGMLDDALESEHDLADAVAEYVNVVAGNLCGKLADDGRELNSSLPEYTLAPTKRYLRPPGMTALVWPVFTTEGDMYVVLERH